MLVCNNHNKMTFKLIILWPFNSTDFNECKHNNGGCEQECINSITGFECGCFTGFSLDANQINCSSKYLHGCKRLQRYENWCIEFPQISTNVNLDFVILMLPAWTVLEATIVFVMMVFLVMVPSAMVSN